MKKKGGGGFPVKGNSIKKGEEGGYHTEKMTRASSGSLECRARGRAGGGGPCWGKMEGFRFRSLEALQVILKR